MPNQPKTRARSFRLSDEDLATLDRLGVVLGKKLRVGMLDRTAVVRHLLTKAAEEELKGKKV